MIIERLYTLLTRIYDVRETCDILAYLIDRPPCPVPPNTKRLANRTSRREAVYIHEASGVVELGLYIDPAILDKLGSENPSRHVDELACAAEGVSHFLYLVDRATNGRNVTRLELELQGEVDKFLALNLISLETDGTTSPELFTIQFEAASYDRRLTAEEIERYRTASHFAAKFCRHLCDACFFPFRPHELISKVRPFFHKDLKGKLAQLIP